MLKVLEIVPKKLKKATENELFPLGYVLYRILFDIAKRAVNSRRFTRSSINQC